MRVETMHFRVKEGALHQSGEIAQPQSITITSFVQSAHCAKASTIRRDWLRAPVCVQPPPNHFIFFRRQDAIPQAAIIPRQFDRTK